MIRILFTIPNFDTAGSGKALLNLALGLDKSKFEAHIACKTDDGQFFETVKNSGLPVHVFDYEAPMRPIGKLLKSAWRISKKLKEINPDIIHSFHYNNNYGEALAAKLSGAKWVFTKKNMNWGSDGANAWKIRSWLADAIVIQNSEMQKRFYPKSGKTVLIERGIRTQKFSPRITDMSLRNEMQTPESARIIITVANLVPIKGVDVLLLAFSKIASKHPDWHLWIVGDDNTETGKKLKTAANKLGLTQKVRFAGKQTDITAYLNHAEIFVLPTKATGEGSPVALIEAMANGKVVLGSNVPGIFDQLQHVPSHLFEPENAESLALALERLMKNDTETNKILGGTFIKHATAKYELQREIDAHEALYLNLAKAQL